MGKKSIIITGASSGIGRALALGLDPEQYLITLVGRNEERLNAIADELTTNHHVHICDVRDAEAVAQMVADTTERFGGVDVLVNNAGLGFFDPLDQGELEQWHTMVDVNIKGVLNCLHAALPSLKRLGGHIVNIGSVASHQVFPNSGVYCATKHALLAISESIKIELMDQVRVTTISPGPVNTDFINKTTNEELQETMREYFATALRPEDVAREIIHAIETPVSVALNEIIIRPTRRYDRP